MVMRKELVDIGKTTVGEAVSITIVVLLYVV